MKTKSIFLLVCLGLIQIFTLDIPSTTAQTVDSNKSVFYSDVIYGHSDSRTEAILNFITGKKSLPENIKTELEIKIAYKMLISPQTYIHDISSEEESGYFDNLMDIKDRLEELLSDRSEIDLRKYRKSGQYLNDVIDIYFCHRFFYKDEEKIDKLQVLVNYFVNTGMIQKDNIMKLEKKQLKKVVADHCNNLSDFEFYSQLIFSFPVYKAIWTMHRNHGNPKVDFSDNFTENGGLGSRAYYNYDFNAMYLGVSYDRSIQMYIMDWMSELTHSDQWLQYSDSVMTLRRKNEINYLDSVKKKMPRYVLSKKSDEQIKDEIFYTKTDSIYGHPTIEKEAHSDKQPLLWLELQGLINENLK
jgi:hypothetical protein